MKPILERFSSRLVTLRMIVPPSLPKAFTVLCMCAQNESRDRLTVVKVEGVQVSTAKKWRNRHSADHKNSQRTKLPDAGVNIVGGFAVW